MKLLAAAEPVRTNARRLAHGEIWVQLLKGGDEELAF
jgi:hypothetical protein